MPKSQRPFLNQSGQFLLIEVLVGLMLVLGVVSVVFVNQLATIHQANSAQGTKGRSVAQEGITYAIQELSASASTWQSALNGNFTGTHCDQPTAGMVVAPSGGHFTLHCSTGTAGGSNNPPLQPYQVAVTAVASVTGGDGQEKPVRAIQAYLAQRTLGVDLANGIHAAAAAEFVRQPALTGAIPYLDVQWGPIVCLDSATWIFYSFIDAQLRPRKFSQGGITDWPGLGTYPRSGNTLGAGPVTDQKEYWAYASQGFPPTVDENYYINKAQTATNFTDANKPRKYSDNSIIQPTSCIGSLQSCSYFDFTTLNDTAVFTGSAPGYTVPTSSTVVYIKGGITQFSATAIDVSNGAFIITGNLKVANNSGGSASNLHVPVTAPSEYPYYKSDGTGIPVAWPCSSKPVMSGLQPAYNCSLASDAIFPVVTAFQFRGFLYVKGNFNLNAMTTNWTMVGSLLVGDMQATPGTGGQLINQMGSWSVNVAYDDIINHNIHVNPITNTGAIKIVPDYVKDVPAY